MLNKFKKFFFVTLRIKKYKFLSDCKRVTYLGKPKMFHPVLLNGDGKINIGYDLQNGVIGSSNYYSHYNYLQARNSDSEINIGNNVVFNNGVSIVAISKITIEDKVMIGINCSIVDSDGHELIPEARIGGNPESQPIIIKENVILFPNVTVLKGVTIGKNSAIGSGSIVNKDIPDNVFAAGVPAKVIRHL